MRVLIIHIYEHQRASVTRRSKQAEPGRCLFLMLTLLFVFAAQARALPASVFPDIAHGLNSTEVDWGDVYSMELAGVPIRTSVFTSLHPVADIAQKFSKTSGLFDRVLTSPGQVVMSGINDGWHWLAALRNKADGAAGYVSVMRVMPTLPADTPLLLPVGARRVSSFKDDAGDNTVVQHVHQVAWSPDVFRNRTQEHLIRQGWEADTSPGNPGSQWHWQRNGERLAILTLAHPGGALVFTQQWLQGVQQ